MQQNRARAGRARPYQPESESRYFWLSLIIIAALAAAAWYFWFRGEPEPAIDESVIIEPREPEPAPFWEREAEETEPRYRVPEVLPEPVAEPEVEADPRQIDDVVVEPEAREPLPPLTESDEPLRQALAELADEQQLWELFVPDFLIRYFVVTIDNMTAAKLPQQYNFARPTPGTFAVRQANDDTFYLEPRNQERYERFVSFVEAVDIGRAVALYVRFYPLLQQAYEDLGFPHRYFNDRFVQVIDHLLQTPKVEQPIELVRPKVYYQFADPELEALSAGQKLMIRIGPDNAERIKARLRALRTELTTLDTAVRTEE